MGTGGHSLICLSHRCLDPSPRSFLRDFMTVFNLVSSVEDESIISKYLIVVLRHFVALTASSLLDRV